MNGFRLLAFALPTLSVAVASPTETIRVEIKTLTGGSMQGLVVAHTDHGLVLMADETPFVFAWAELETGSAFRAKRDILHLERNGAEHLTAEDHFQLGMFVLSRGRGSLAVTEFRRAERLDVAYKQRSRDALDAHRRQRQKQQNADNTPVVQATPPIEQEARAKLERGLGDRIDSAIDQPDAAFRSVGTTPEIRAKATEVYRAFGAAVTELFGPAVKSIETDHFVIWTDLDRVSRARLGTLCESMYRALCREFSFDPTDNVFLAKCPIFCWRSKARFLRFAQQLDDHPARNSIGYTRSIERNGHVHLVLLRQGRTQADVDRLACTLVHEGTHAFLHRTYSTRLIPHWVNEGFADLMAERVLGDRCFTAENAELLARQYARYDWPITGLLESTGPIEVHRYPLAHSVVAFLHARDTIAWAGFMADLKTGETVASALAARYDGMTLSRLESLWRQAVRERETARQRQ